MQINTNIIKVQRDELVKVLKENLTKHVAEYSLAIVQYRKDVVEEMTELLARVSKGDTLRTSLQKHTHQPVSNEAAYERAIKKYSMSVDQTIYLDDTQFDQFIMDNWQWKHSISNSMYAASATMNR